MSVSTYWRRREGRAKGVGSGEGRSRGASRGEGSWRGSAHAAARRMLRPFSAPPALPWACCKRAHASTSCPEQNKTTKAGKRLPRGLAAVHTSPPRSPDRGPRRRMLDVATGHTKGRQGHGREGGGGGGGRTTRSRFLRSRFTSPSKMSRACTGAECKRKGDPCQACMHLFPRLPGQARCAAESWAARGGPSPDRVHARGQPLEAATAGGASPDMHSCVPRRSFPHPPTLRTFSRTMRSFSRESAPTQAGGQAGKSLKVGGPRRAGGQAGGQVGRGRRAGRQAEGQELEEGEGWLGSSSPGTCLADGWAHRRSTGQWQPGAC